MTNSSAGYAPDWVSPPGETILDLIEERGWKQGELARRLGYTDKHISQLINGRVPLTDEAALRLERVLGSSASFWLSREAKYREHSARLAMSEMYSKWVDWLDELPLEELMNSGTIPKVRNTKNNKPGIVESCLRFFGVASPEDWHAHYFGMQVSFRRSRVEQSDIGAISSWLRLGEQEAESADCPKYDRIKFKEALSIIRGLTQESPEIFETRMRDLLHSAGVIFILVPAIPRAHVSGVARWLNSSRPVIQLSLYGKTNDKFWFTFFHEAAHILLHANTKEEKKSVFLDDPNAGHINDPIEHEANQWSGDWLIPPVHEDVLKGLRSKDAVIRFASKINIHPGIVVGRLQHDGYIKPSWMNHLKESFKLEG